MYQLCAKHKILQRLLVLTVSLRSQTKLQQLDIDQISSQIGKYDSHIDELEEGLPKNSVVADLKDKLGVMRHMVGNTACTVHF